MGILPYNRILQGTLTFLILACIFPFMVVFLVLLIIRFFVSILAKLFRPDLDGFVTGMSGVVSCWPEFNVMPTFFVAGDVSIKRIRDSFENKILKDRSDDGPYRKFRQTLTNFLGFAFWKEDLDFELENHVREFDYTEHLEIPAGSTEVYVQGVCNEILTTPWQEGRSPWEILVVRISQDGAPPETAIIFRFHHVLMDGYSFVELLGKLFGTKCKLAAPKAFIEKRFGIQAYLRVPFDFAGMLLDHYYRDYQPEWRLKRDGGTKKHHTSVLKTIPVSLIKKAKAELGLSYIAVLFAVMGGAVERMFAQAQLPTPTHLNTIIPMPRPNHPGGLENHMTMCPVKWPIKSKSTATRAQEIQRQFTEMSNSLTPRLLFLLPELIGLFPSFLRRPCADFVGSGYSIMVTNFPVSENQLYWDDLLMTVCHAGFGMAGDTAGANVMMAGINGNQGFVLKMDKNMFPSETILQCFGGYVEHELLSLLPSVLEHKDR